jgi:hypothetical protein
MNEQQQISLAIETARLILENKEVEPEEVHPYNALTVLTDSGYNFSQWSEEMGRQFHIQWPNS